MSSFDEISKMFDTESQKLENLITTAESNSQLSIHQIVEIYYQVMNISSMIAMLKQQPDTENQAALLDNITKTEKIISEKFNSSIHPQIIKNLSNSIQEITDRLQSNDLEQKSKEAIENESKQYEELRKMMSTKEFVEQYDKGLHD